MDELLSGGAEMLDDLGRSQGSVINSNLVVDRLSPGAESWPARITNDKTKILESARSSMMGMRRILVQSGSMPSSRSLAANRSARWRSASAQLAFGLGALAFGLGALAFGLGLLH